MSPSCLASRSGTRWEPPTNRRSCAPFAVSELRENVPSWVSSPEHATYQSVKRNESSLGSAPKPGWVQQAMRFSMPAALTALRADPLARASSSPTRGPAGAPRVRRRRSRRRTRRSAGAAARRRRGSSGPAGRCRGTPAGRWSRRRRRCCRCCTRRNVGTPSSWASAAMWFWVGPMNAPPDSMTWPPCFLRQVVVEHPAADPLAGLDHAAPTGPLRATSRAATRPAMPRADHDHVDLRGQRALAGPAEDGGLRSRARSARRCRAARRRRRRPRAGRGGRRLGRSKIIGTWLTTSGSPDGSRAGGTPEMSRLR